jgi:hypothetical protein
MVYQARSFSNGTFFVLPHQAEPVGPIAKTRSVPTYMSRRGRGVAMGRKALDLAGQKFGRLLVIERAPPDAGSGRWVCACDCGAGYVGQAADIARGRVRSCGCLRLEQNRAYNARKRLDLVGSRFGRLAVESLAGPGVWLCRCDCGACVTATTANLRAGNTQSCGCLRREVTGSLNRKHGMSESPEFGVWLCVIRRCENPADIGWTLYGGRGIRMCRRWREDFAAFYADMGPRPSPKHSVDRVDNARGYDCGVCEDCRARGSAFNCRWATPAEQSRNRRTNRLLTIDGKTMCVADWSRVSGVSRQTIDHRLAFGWPPERAVFQPSQRRTA